MATKDINDDWGPFLSELYKLVQILKVPGKKAKSYEQTYVRTMFFEKCSVFQIDGKTYNISMASEVQLWNCKSRIVEIYNYFDPDTMDRELDMEKYQSWRKELIKLLKEWDKIYMTHMKSGYVEMSEIHKTAMKPLTDLMESNLNFTFLEALEKQRKGDVPSFRHEALETKFIDHMTGVCDIFKNFGGLDLYYNIKQQLTILKTEDWRVIPPLRYYL